ncbi:hydroxyethylthiazole kinase [Clostridium boliviensis]|uniref:Hydroxyethylthiazole kinase n=1 Tax=Clostridium boliviensis TaxID=318465 RepID=A0ABU4GSV4_9CLOT|nr:hydroxyethylthiazole kinase [Clostridium boliviensis]MDW2800718.1 hydroxyethylthiazole kinase [Clostridium boliviensis]
MFEQMITNVRNNVPLVHAITNYVTVNDCANIILASGGSPIMADDINEVRDIAAISSALVLNMGTLNERTIASMLAAGTTANQCGIPVVLDPVGAGASAFRNKTVLQLLKEVRFSVIKGNISEIKFLAAGEGRTSGVDACEADKVTEVNLGSVADFAKSFSKKTGSVIAITGAIDLVADHEHVYAIRNGHPMMSKITGTGCMLSMVTGSYIGANPGDILRAAAAAVCGMGLCGELAHKRLCELQGGTGMYRMLLIDEMSKLNEKILEEGANYECIER